MSIKLTVTVVVAVEEPPALVAVSLYMVVVFGEIALKLVFVTSPMPLSIVTVVALDTFQSNVVGLPRLIPAGAALKLEMTGAGVELGAIVASLNCPISMTQYHPG